jgi:hypothetical protein
MADNTQKMRTVTGIVNDVQGKADYSSRIGDRVRAYGLDICPVRHNLRVCTCVAQNHHETDFKVFIE